MTRISLHLLAVLAACAAGIVPDAAAQSGGAGWRACAGDDKDTALAACGRIADDASQPAETRARALFNRALVHSALKRRAEARKDLDASIALLPTAAAHLARGLWHRDGGDVQRQIADYDAALRLNPRSTVALNNKGVVYADLGRKSEAIELFDRAIEIAPREAAAYNNKANVLSGLRPAEAAVEFGRAAKLDAGLAALYRKGTRPVIVAAPGKFSEPGAAAATPAQPAAPPASTPTAAAAAGGIVPPSVKAGDHSKASDDLLRATQSFDFATAVAYARYMVARPDRDARDACDWKLGLARALRQLGAMAEAETQRRAAAGCFEAKRGGDSGDRDFDLWSTVEERIALLLDSGRYDEVIGFEAEGLPKHVLEDVQDALDDYRLDAMKRKGAPAEAEALLDRKLAAATTSNERISALVGRVEFSLWRGRNDDARRDIAEIGRLRPGYFRLHELRARLLAEEGDFDAAREVIAAGEKLAEQRLAETYRLIGGFYDAALGDYRKAAATFHEDSSPSERRSHAYARALAAMRAGTFDAAMLDALPYARSGSVWPATVRAFIGGDIGREAFLESARLPNLTLRGFAQCHAVFMSGIVALDRGDTETAKRDLADAAQKCATQSHRLRTWARGELRRL